MIDETLYEELSQVLLLILTQSCDYVQRFRLIFEINISLGKNISGKRMGFGCG